MPTMFHCGLRENSWSTAHGLKFTGFKVGYHEGGLAEVESEYANPPVYLPPDTDVVRETIQRKLDA